jgi:hypothetical protein
MQKRSSISLYLACVAICLSFAFNKAQAKKLLLTCMDGTQKYDVTFDTVSKTITTTHRLFKRPITTERYEEHDDAHLLVWGVMDLGTARRNFLAHFGREKWVKHFTGYNDVTTHECI